MAVMNAPLGYQKGVPRCRKVTKKAKMVVMAVWLLLLLLLLEEMEEKRRLDAVAKELLSRDVHNFSMASDIGSGSGTQYPSLFFSLPKYLDTIISPPRSAGEKMNSSAAIPGRSAKIPEKNAESPSALASMDYSTTKSRMKTTLLDSEPSPVNTTQELPMCDSNEANLMGILMPLASTPSLEYQALHHPELRPGGRYRPPSCRADQSVAIIVPYRNRPRHLESLVYHLHPVLQRQQIAYTIFVIEQAEGKIFNRGMIKNIGAAEVLKTHGYDCLIFHDVDLIPLHDHNLYRCTESPRHMSVAVDKFNFKLPYVNLIGGVMSVPQATFHRVNGFNNNFWGWGGEDDDLQRRFTRHKISVTRHAPSISRYHMIRHRPEKPSPYRMRVLEEGKRDYHKNGLNSLQYEVEKRELRPLYTWIYVKI